MHFLLAWEMILWLRSIVRGYLLVFLHTPALEAFAMSVFLSSFFSIYISSLPLWQISHFIAWSSSDFLLFFLRIRLRIDVEKKNMYVYVRRARGYVMYGLFQLMLRFLLAGFFFFSFRGGDMGIGCGYRLLLLLFFFFIYIFWSAWYYYYFLLHSTIFIRGILGINISGACKLVFSFVSRVDYNYH
ncbi:hypothetical protein P167DRAFT_2809 [Morchella conica CCBAS932]|uniref:Uncharacterized protein n=1 Tax=Morchella conica CCBAS932 TaxID=1392247 RepID=A0A3N4L3R4_9PEZI|nr:hypothetical protein P167DRAFT_2809 [Morchella conica CCBAS932]